jgi:hypothetical protein
MKKLVRKAVVAIVAACAVTCVNNAEDDNYGPVDLNLLTELTWRRTDIEGDPVTVGKMVDADHHLYNYYDWTWYYCDGLNCDTCYRDDTTSTATAIEINGDTITFMNVSWIGKKAVLTKLTEDAMIMKFIDVYGDMFWHYERSHRVLVTRGTGTNAGNDTIDYQE